jgi:hypothetical protein
MGKRLISRIKEFSAFLDRKQIDILLIVIIIKLFKDLLF